MFKSGDTYIFTVRDSIKSVPRITQEKVYITPFEMKLVSSFDFLFSVEKAKDKKANKELLKTYKTEMHKISHNKEKFECFTDNTIVGNCLGKYVETTDGYYNLIRK